MSSEIQGALWPIDPVLERAIYQIEHAFALYYSGGRGKALRLSVGKACFHGRLGGARATSLLQFIASGSLISYEQVCYESLGIDAFSVYMQPYSAERWDAGLLLIEEAICRYLDKYAWTGWADDQVRWAHPSP